MSTRGQPGETVSLIFALHGSMYDDQNVRHLEFLFKMEETRFAYVALGHSCLFTIYNLLMPFIFKVEEK